MLTKVCSKCGIEKEIIEFRTNLKCKYGVEGQCKSCYQKYLDATKEHRMQKDREYHQRSDIKEKQKIRGKIYYEQNKEKLKEQVRENYYRNIDRYHKYDKQRSDTEERKQYRKEYNDKYRAENIDRLRKCDIERYPKRRENLEYVLSSAISSGIRRCIGNIKANRHWEDLVNFNFEQLKEHLEKQFTSEMSWNNFGSYWEIDHIIPRNLFNIKSAEDEQFKICWSLANLRPLEKSLNRQRPKDGRDISKEQAINILGLDLYYGIINIKINNSLVL